MNFDKNTLMTILHTAPIHSRMKYGQVDNYSVYLSYYNVGHYGMHDVIICIVDGIRVGILLKIGQECIAMFDTTEYAGNVKLKQAVHEHWRIKSLYIMPWQNTEQMQKIADKLELGVSA